MSTTPHKRGAPLLVLVLVLGALGACADDDVGNLGRGADDGSSTAATGTDEPTAPPSSAVSPDPYAAQVRAWGEVTDRYGYLRKYVQVAPGLTDDQLVDLTGQLHEGEPETWFYLLDDDERIQQLLDSLPATAEGDLSEFPTDWVEQHLVAQVVLELEPDGGQRYVVYRGSSSDVIGVLSD